MILAIPLLLVSQMRSGGATSLQVYHLSFKLMLCLQCWYQHRNLSVIVLVSPHKILYSYVALVSAPSCIWQYKFVHKFATLR